MSGRQHCSTPLPCCARWLASWDIQQAGSAACWRIRRLCTAVCMQLVSGRVAWCLPRRAALSAQRMGFLTVHKCTRPLHCTRSHQALSGWTPDAVLGSTDDGICLTVVHNGHVAYLPACTPSNGSLHSQKQQWSLFMPSCKTDHVLHPHQCFLGRLASCSCGSAAANWYQAASTGLQVAAVALSGWDLGIAGVSSSLYHCSCAMPAGRRCSQSCI